MPVQPYYTGSGVVYRDPTMFINRRRANVSVKAPQEEAGLFDAEGLPTRAPKTAQEAIQFQFQAAQAARKMQEQRVASAINTLKYGMGMALRSSPYSIAAMQTPYLRDIAQANLGVQYGQPDYSYFLRSGAFGGGGGGGYGGGGRSAMPVMGYAPGIPTGPTPGIANYNPLADNPVYSPAQRAAMVQNRFPNLQQQLLGPAPNYRVDFSGIDQSPNPYALPVAGAQEDF